jgi:adenylate kinase
MRNTAKNPYNPSFGQKPERFLGRSLIVNEVLSALDNSNSPSRTTLVIGVRGSGKTALLSDIRESVKMSDCIVVSVSPGNDMLNDILSQLYSDTPTSIFKNLPKPSKLTIAGAMEFNIENNEPYFLKNFRYQITKMLEELRKKKMKVLFLIDESQKHSEGMRTFISVYQHLISERFEVYMVLAGLPNVISDILNDDVLTFLRRANQVVLDNVDLLLVNNDFMEAFYKEYEVSEKDINFAASITEGYPYLIQLVGFYLWEFMNSGMESENMLEQVTIHAKAMMFQNVHKLLYRELSSGDREFVNAMAVDKKVSKFSDILSRTGKSKNYISTYRTRLIDLGYIKAVARGELAFSLPFTRDFLLQEMKFAES